MQSRVGGNSGVAVLASRRAGRDNGGVAHIIPDQPRSAAMPAGLAGILEALHQTGPERITLDRREFAFIQAARVLGATWDQIADALGHGDPQQRYGELRERFAPPDLDGT